MRNNNKYRLLELMKQNNLSAMDLATKCQVHVQTVYHWSKISQESDLSMPADQMKKMARLFGVTMEEMYTDLVTA